MNQSNFRIVQNLWEIIQLKNSCVYYWRIGEANLWIQKHDNEIHIATSYIKQNIIDDLKSFPPRHKWSRYAVKDDNFNIELKPIMPDRPVVVKPQASFYLTNGMKKTIYIKIPVWISINIGEHSKIKLFEFPSVILSNTWFGDLIMGELAYWLSSDALSEIETNIEDSYLAICPITLQNASNDNLLVDKFVLRSENSMLFLHKKQLWSDEVFISFKGTDDTSAVVFKGTTAKFLTNCTKIAEPRKKHSKKIWAPTFNSIKKDGLLGMPVK